MKVLIIEDNPSLVIKYKSYFKRFDDTIEIIAVLKSLNEVKSFFNSNSRFFDIIFSDIMLPDGNIFDFLSSFNNIYPIIFVTSFSEYKLNAIQERSIEYLVKPFSFEEFSAAIRKFESIEKHNIIKKIHNIKDFRLSSQVNCPGFVVAYSNDGYCNISSSLIKLIRADKNQIIAVDVNNLQHVLKYSSLSLFLNVYSGNDLFKLNRSEIINVNFISEIELLENDIILVVLKNFENNSLFSTHKTTPLLRKFLGL